MLKEYLARFMAFLVLATLAFGMFWCIAWMFATLPGVCK